MSRKSSEDRLKIEALAEIISFLLNYGVSYDKIEKHIDSNYRELFDAKENSVLISFLHDNSLDELKYKMFKELRAIK